MLNMFYFKKRNRLQNKLRHTLAMVNFMQCTGENKLLYNTHILHIKQNLDFVHQIMFLPEKEH